MELLHASSVELFGKDSLINYTITWCNLIKNGLSTEFLLIKGYEKALLIVTFLGRIKAVALGKSY